MTCPKVVTAMEMFYVVKTIHFSHIFVEDEKTKDVLERELRTFHMSVLKMKSRSDAQRGTAQYLITPDRGSKDSEVFQKGDLCSFGQSVLKMKRQDVHTKTVQMVELCIFFFYSLSCSSKNSETFQIGELYKVHMLNYVFFL